MLPDHCIFFCLRHDASMYLSISTGIHFRPNKRSLMKMTLDAVINIKPADAPTYGKTSIKKINRNSYLNNRTK